MGNHVIKYTYDNGKKLDTPTLWCGANDRGFFQDAQHAALAALAAGGSIQTCRLCIKAIIKELEKEL